MHGRLCLAAEPRLSSPSLRGIWCTTPGWTKWAWAFSIKNKGHLGCRSMMITVCLVFKTQSYHIQYMQGRFDKELDTAVTNSSTPHLLGAILVYKFPEKIIEDHLPWFVTEMVSLRMSPNVTPKSSPRNEWFRMKPPISTQDDCLWE